MGNHCEATQTIKGFSACGQSSYKEFDLQRQTTSTKSQFSTYQSNAISKKAAHLLPKRFTLRKCTKEEQETLGHLTQTIQLKLNKMPSALQEQSRRVEAKVESFYHLKADHQECFFGGEADFFGRPHQVGVQYHRDGRYYAGDYVEGKKEGFGLVIHPNNDAYFGQWANSAAHGEGSYYHAEGGVFNGKWIQDVREGEGQQLWLDGTLFKGYFTGGDKTEGQVKWSDGTSYCGSFINERFHGRGTYLWPDGRCYNGEWQDGLMHGAGLFSWANGQRFEGHYQKDLKHGSGTIFLPDGSIVRGVWKAGELIQRFQ